MTFDDALATLLKRYAREVREAHAAGDDETAGRLTRRRHLLSGWMGARASDRNQAIWDAKRQAMADAAEPLNDRY
jgi:hypothetical protein